MIKQLAVLVCFVAIIFNEKGVANAAVCPAPAACPPEYIPYSYASYNRSTDSWTTLVAADGCNRVLDILARLNSINAASSNVRASLVWDNTNNLDGMVTLPVDSYDPYGDPIVVGTYSRTNGDANLVSPYTSTPIEYTVVPNGDFASGSSLDFTISYVFNRANVDPSSAYVLLESYNNKRQLVKITDLQETYNSDVLATIFAINFTV